jgi:hypothetical protein
VVLIGGLLCWWVLGIPATRRSPGTAVKPMNE